VILPHPPVFSGRPLINTPFPQKTSGEVFSAKNGPKAPLFGKVIFPPFLKRVWGILTLPPIQKSPLKSQPPF